MYQGFPIVLRGREEAKAGTARSKAELHDAASQSAMWVPASLPSPGDVTGKRDPCMNHYAPPKEDSTWNKGRRELSKSYFTRQERITHQTYSGN